MYVVQTQEPEKIIVEGEVEKLLREHHRAEVTRNEVNGLMQRRALTPKDMEETVRAAAAERSREPLNSYEQCGDKLSAHLLQRRQAAGH